MLRRLFPWHCNQSAQLVYEGKGRARCLLEAAAARGFAHVSTDLLDNILHDMAETAGTKPRLSKVSRIVEFWKGSWDWSKVDVAKALMLIMPGAKPPAARRATPDSTGREFVWSDLPSIAAALEAHRLGTEAESSPQLPPPMPSDDAVIDAINFFDDASARRSAPPAPHSKRASARSFRALHCLPKPPCPRSEATEIKNLVKPGRCKTQFVLN
jgi:hypothetical protein